MTTTYRKQKTGFVVSDKMDKTIVVKVVRLTKHPLYGKVIKKIKKFYAHDQDNVAKVGDQVTIFEGRPMSRLKRWFLKVDSIKKLNR